MLRIYWMLVISTYSTKLQKMVQKLFDSFCNNEENNFYRQIFKNI